MSRPRDVEFENDIFISYAHIDNQALMEGDKGWITDLHRALDIRLSQLLGRRPKIWRDPKLQGNDYFADTLVDRLPQVATIVSIVSPRYLTSEWCRRELTEFHKMAEGSLGVRVGDKSRIFKVVKTPVPIEEHPEEVAALLGYEFFVLDPQSGRPRELAQKDSAERQRLYWARLDDLAQDLAELLTNLADQQPAPAAAPEEAAASPAESAEDGTVVYLAETIYDLRDERDVIKRELLGHDCHVLPDRRLPLVGPELEDFVRQELTRARISIHMVGQNYGVIPEGATESTIVMQNDLALERGAELTRLVWMPPDLEIDDERQRHFVESLETDPRIQRGADIFKTPLEDFKTAVLEKLKPPEPAPEPAAAAGDEGPRRIYLISDQRDLDQTLELEDFLFDLGFEVIPSVFDGDEAQVRRDHEESMVLCDAALVYYGAGNELWLRRKMRELQKSAGLGRTRPFLATGVYVAPTDDPRKRRFRSHEAIVMQAGDQLQAVLQPFVDPLRTS